MQDGGTSQICQQEVFTILMCPPVVVLDMKNFMFTFLKGMTIENQGLVIVLFSPRLVILITLHNIYF